MRLFLLTVLMIALALTGCAGSGEATRAGGPPAWFAGPDAGRRDARYLTATGTGPTAAAAERQALAALARTFAAEIDAAQVLRDDIRETDAALARTTRRRDDVRVTARETIRNTQTLRLEQDADGRFYALVGLHRMQTAALLQADLDARRAARDAALRDAAAAAQRAAPVERLAHARRAVTHAAAVATLRRQLAVIDGGLPDPDAPREAAQARAAEAAFRAARAACPVALRADAAVPERVRLGVAEALEAAGFALVAAPEAAVLVADVRYDAAPTLATRADAAFVAWTLALALTDRASGAALDTFVADARSGALTPADAARRAHRDAADAVRRDLPAALWSALAPAETPR